MIRKIMLKDYFQNYSPNIQKLFWDFFSQKSKKKYGGMEFKWIRDYVFWDNPKHIFWKSYAQNQRMTTKIFDDLELVPINFYIFLTPSFIFDDAMLWKNKKDIINGFNNKTFFSKLDFALSLIKENIIRIYKDSYYNNQKIIITLLYEDNGNIKQYKKIIITKSTFANMFYGFTKIVKNYYNNIITNEDSTIDLDDILKYIHKIKKWTDNFSLFTDIVNFWNQTTIPKNINLFTFLTWFELNGKQHGIQRFTKIMNFMFWWKNKNNILIDNNINYYKELNEEIEKMKINFRKRNSNYFLIEV